MKKISETIQIDEKAFDGRNMSDLFAHLLEQAGKEWPDKMIFDCTKIDVSSDIQNLAYDSFMNNVGAPEAQCNMYWACAGPKVDNSLPPNTIVLYDGYLMPENEQETDHTAVNDNDHEENSEI